MTTLHAAAFKGELGETLTFAGLSELRASSFEGLDRDLYSRLLAGTEGRIAAGLVQCTTITVQRSTGDWIERRPYDPDRDSSLDRGKVITHIVSNLSGSQKPKAPPGGSIEPAYESITELRFTREQARQLYAVDPENWGEGALKWVGLDIRTKVEIPENADDDPPDDLVGATGVELKQAKVLLGPHVDGGENFVNERHRRRSREKHYTAAFDANGLINCPVFWAIAKARGCLNRTSVPSTNLRTVQSVK
jgi:hypothetical protein